MKNEEFAAASPNGSYKFRGNKRFEHQKSGSKFFILHSSFFIQKL